MRYRFFQVFVGSVFVALGCQGTKSDLQVPCTADSDCTGAQSCKKGVCESIGVSSTSCKGGAPAWEVETGDSFGVAVTRDPVSDDIVGASRAIDDHGVELRRTLVRLTSTGEQRWSRALDSVEGVLFDDLGQLFVTGSFAAQADLDGHALAMDPPDVWAAYVAELEADGSVRWATAVTDPTAHIRGLKLASDGDSGVILLAWYSPVLPPSAYPNPPTIGGFLLARFDSSGNERWRITVGDNSTLVIEAGVAVDPRHHMTVAGHVNMGTIDLGAGPIPDSVDGWSFAAQFDLEGNHLWSRTLPNGLRRANSITTDGDSQIYIGGSLLTDTATQPFVTKLSSDGTILWTDDISFAHQNDDVLVASRSCGGVFVTTNWQGEADMGDAIIEVSAAGETAAIHEKPPPDGAWLSAVTADGHDGILLVGDRRGPATPPSFSFVSHWKP